MQAATEKPPRRRSFDMARIGPRVHGIRYYVYPGDPPPQHLHMHAANGGEARINERTGQIRNDSMEKRDLPRR